MAKPGKQLRSTMMDAFLRSHFSKKLLFPTLLAALTSIGVLAQQGHISGKIKSIQGEDINAASVFIEEIQVGTASDADGTFVLTGLDTGIYTLNVSCIGFLPQKKQVKVTEKHDQTVVFVLKDQAEQLREVVVTATRTERPIDNIPMPVDIIAAGRIRQTGALRLNEVLLEQTGVQIVSDHGTGIQMQGLSSDYILVLIDGEPLIGRTAGTLDLTRIAIDNIERVEIIRGPSSSLYGNEAMAGVINIITKGMPGTQVNLRNRYRSFNTWDNSLGLSFTKDKASISLFGNRVSSSGYALNKESVSMTVPPYEAYTFNPKFNYHFNDQLKLSVSGRFYSESQANQQDITIDSQSFRLLEKGIQKDWNLMPTLEYQINSRNKLLLKNYTTQYTTDRSINYQVDGAAYDHSFFNQLFNRVEAQYDAYLSRQHVFTVGAGHTFEKVEASRYDDVNGFRANYGFVQHQWIPGDKFNLVAGGRFDMHSQYASRVSPKLAAGYTFNKWIKAQASLGGGYKAPDFRQLLLNFTNPTAGYTVMGTSVVKRGIADLQNQGLIDITYIDPASIGEINAERSFSYNAGVTVTPIQKMSLRANFYRNNINGLIETAPVARKTNGQNVFSYFNYDKVLTQGVETQLDYKLLDNIQFSLGYQYLDSRNVEVYRELEEGRIFRRDPATNRTVRVQPSEYGGLFNRSRHSGNAKIFYENHQHRFDWALRGIFRGKWGFGDVNGNGILDDKKEYADGYLLLNLAVNKHFFEWLTIEAGANNLLGVSNPYEPTLAGTIWYGGVNLKLSK